MLTFLGYKDRYFIFLKTSYRVLMATMECGCERQNRRTAFSQTENMDYSQIQ